MAAPPPSSAAAATTSTTDGLYMAVEDPHASDPLPPGWTRQYSKSQQRNFYFHKETKHTQWHFPTASEAKDPRKAKERAEANKEREERKRTNHEKSSGTSEEGMNNGGADVGGTVENPSKEWKRPRTTTTDDDLIELDATSVAIIVPYRDLHVEQKRAAHLGQFVPHMVSFLLQLKKQGKISNYHVYIVEQSNDGLKFNRGKLLNIGFDLARKAGKRHDVFIFHDVDLLPQPDLGAWYSKFPKTPIHIARVWDRYSNNPKYFGGVVSFSSSDYKRINGYPNNYWGWGGEDDEMQRRLERLGIQFESPNRGTLVDLEQMTLTEKLDFLRSHKEWKCMVKWELNSEHESTWKTNGLADLKYKVVNTVSLDATQHSSKITVDVQMNGSHWTNEKAGVDFVG